MWGDMTSAARDVDDRMIARHVRTTEGLIVLVTFLSYRDDLL